MITLAEIKTILGVSDATQDAFLTHWIAVVSNAIEEFCGRSFSQKNYKEIFYRNDWPMSNLRTYHYPIVAITSIKDQDGNNILPHFRVHRPTGSLDMIQRLSWDEIEVEYSAGNNELPPIVKEVLVSIIKEKYNRSQSGIDLNFGADVQRVSIAGSLSVDFDYSLENNSSKNDLGMILGNYKNMLNPYVSAKRVINTQVKHYVE